MSEHTAKINWEKGEQVFTDGKYSRKHLISFDGGISIAGSANPEVVRPPLGAIDAADPEELVCAAIGSCHMLYFLDFTRRAGFNIESYEDNPIAIMGKNDAGKTALISITLHPKVKFIGDAPNHEQMHELHHKAHDYCIIANSLACPVTIEGY